MRRGVAALAAFAAMALAGPAAGSAAVSEYAPAQQARDFTGGVGGWTNATSFGGICLPPLLCPTATNAHFTSGGADDGGFIRSGYLGVIGVLGVGGTTTATWESPQFTYSGSNGEAPDTVALSLSRRSNVGQLLAVSGNAATYDVELVDLSAGGTPLPLVQGATLAGAAGWTAVPAIAISPSQLTIGHAYKIRIRSIYATGTSVLATGSADYDDVVLRAATGSDANPPNNNGGGGGGSVEQQKLLTLVGAVLPTTAVVVGNRILLNVRCPAAASAACRITAQGLLTKKIAATTRRKAKVAKGASKRLALGIRAKARDAVAKRKSLRFRFTYKVGATKVKITRGLELIRR